MRRISLCGLCLCLSLLLVSPSFLVISSLPMLPTERKLLSVRAESSTGFITPDVGSYRETKKVDRYTVIETYTNGTKVHFGMHIYINDSSCTDVWANFTAWLPENTTSEASQSSTSFQPLTEGNLPTIRVDNLTFLQHASNSTCYTTYEHDDNYQVYYPLEWDYPYALQGTAYTHLHLAVDILNSWVNENISDAIFIGICFLSYQAINLMTDDLVDLMLHGGEAIKNKVFDEIVGYVSDDLGMPWIGVFYSMFAWAQEFIDFLSEFIQPLLRAYWVNQYVRETFGGDGWN